MPVLTDNFHASSLWRELSSKVTKLVDSVGGFIPSPNALKYTLYIVYTTRHFYSQFISPSRASDKNDLEAKTPGFQLTKETAGPVVGTDGRMQGTIRRLGI